MSIKDGQKAPGLHSIGSAAAFLGGLSISTIRRWIAMGQLNSVKVGRRRVMIRESELLALIKPEQISPAKQWAASRTVARTNQKLSEDMTMIDAIDELVARSKDHRELRVFHKLHRAHPELLDFLTQEIQLRLDHGFESFSYHSLWEYARWKIEMKNGPQDTFKMNDHAAPFYARAITILHPEFNGRAEFRPAKEDSIFGTRVEPISGKRPKNYARRLQWADGTTLEGGWRPRAAHTIGVVPRKPDIHGRGK